MAGEIASLLISRMAVPVLYSMLARRREARRARRVVGAAPLPPLPANGAARIRGEANA